MLTNVICKLDHATVQYCTVRIYKRAYLCLIIDYPMLYICSLECCLPTVIYDIGL